MPSAKHSVVIERPVSEVFAYVIDGTTAPTWRPSCIDVRLASGAQGQVGARYEQGLKGPRGRIAGDYELTEVVPNKVIAFKVVAGPARPQGRYEVARTMPGEGATLDNLKRVLEGRPRA
jgi:uncharacterized protein YndB with AHSA1/START domain